MSERGTNSSGMEDRSQPPPNREGVRGEEESVRTYGPPEDEDSSELRTRMDMMVRPNLTLGDKLKLEELLKEIRLKKEKNRISEDEAESLPILSVKVLDPCVRENAYMHYTNQYHCTHGVDANPVLRRGQEVKVILTLDRPYQKDKDELFFILEAEISEEEKESLGSDRKKLHHIFQLEGDRPKPYTLGDKCHARLQSAEKNQVTVALFLAGTLAVGEWDLKIRTRLILDRKTSLDYEFPKSVFVLFNPWSPADQVHYSGDKKDLKEYVLNNSGTMYRGSAGSVYGSPWTYGHFEKRMLHICASLLRKAFDFHMTQDMGDPLIVSRALSRIVNSSDDQGVLTGNWSGNYEGGVAPSDWTSATAILKMYTIVQQPVKYGQCWVFSHVLTAVCRALGLPCRSVTNFASAHDTDGSCTIDQHVDSEGDVDKSLNRDSIWNFHVWNEVWILRPDLAQDGLYDGWHVIDATPQETSEGLYQCGPCPVVAVKRGEIWVGQDTPFVFSEVNASVIEWWSPGPNSPHDVVSAVYHHWVGRDISTKSPDTGDRLDITDTYKYPEGSEEEKAAVEKAVTHAGRKAKAMYTQAHDLELTFHKDTETRLGKDVAMTTKVKNLTAGDKDVLVTFTARTCKYFDPRRGSDMLAKERFQVRTLKPGQVESFKLLVPVKAYSELCDDQLSMFGYVCARDITTGIPYTAQQVYTLNVPDLTMEGPKMAKSGEKVRVRVSFTNPLSFPLRYGKFLLDTNLTLHPDHKTGWAKLFSGVRRMKFRDVQAQEKVTLDVYLVGSVEADDTPTEKTANVTFKCAALKTPFKGLYSVQIQPRVEVASPAESTD